MECVDVCNIPLVREKKRTLDEMVSCLSEQLPTVWKIQTRSLGSEGFFDVFLFVLFVDKTTTTTLHLKLVDSKQVKRKQRGNWYCLEAVQELVLEIRRKKMRQCGGLRCLFEGCQEHHRVCETLVWLAAQTNTAGGSVKGGL